ncbi:hypothetical protein Lal_00011175 [Lupinus albus]|nr:hypothetical protein Lal_00011175 [Lupinus albus]
MGLVLTNEQLQILCSLEIEKLHERNRRSLKDYPSMSYPNGYITSQLDNRLIYKELNYDIDELKKNFNTIFNSLASTSIFICIEISKAYCINCGFKWYSFFIITWVRQYTLNSKYLFQLLTTPFTTFFKGELVELLKQTKLIICDEARMTHNFCFETLDKSLGNIMGTINSTTLFGGKVVVFEGDFRQILRVVSKGCRSDTIGNRKLSQPNDVCARTDILEEPLISLALTQTYKDEQFLQCRAILASTIEIVDQINDYVIKKYLKSYEVDMSDVNESETFNILTPKLLNSLLTFGLPNHKIKLKTNLKGLCNGTRLVITKMTNHVLEAKVMSREKHWKYHLYSSIINVTIRISMVFHAY